MSMGFFGFCSPLHWLVTSAVRNLQTKMGSWGTIKYNFAILVEQFDGLREMEVSHHRPSLWSSVDFPC